MCLQLCQDSFAICSFASRELADAALDAQVVFSNKNRALFRTHSDLVQSNTR